jgi:hypothetical protein
MTAWAGREFAVAQGAQFPAERLLDNRDTELPMGLHLLVWWFHRINEEGYRLCEEKGDHWRARLEKATVVRMSSHRSQGESGTECSVTDWFRCIWPLPEVY